MITITMPLKLINALNLTLEKRVPLGGLMKFT